MSTKIPVMSLDMAFANTGIVLANYDVNAKEVEVEHLDLAKTEADKANKKVVRKNSDDLRRANETLTAIDKAIDEHNPAYVFVEVPTGAQSARAAWALGIAVGMIAHVARRVPVIQVTPKEVKDVTGERHPDKADMIAWAVKKYPDINWPRRGEKIIAGQAEHMADAVAAIHAGVLTDEFQRIASLYKTLGDGGRTLKPLNL